MRKGQWLLYLWPGLPELWQHGWWSSLALAAGFAGLLNLALAVSLVWTAWISPELRFALWTAVVSFWILAAWSARRQVGQGTEAALDLFSRATCEYLQGNWYEAEHLLGQLLRQDRRDVDAHLMLATLLRHTARRDEARQLLERLRRLEGAEKWELEIQREFELLARPAEENESAEEEAAETIAIPIAGSEVNPAANREVRESRAA